MTLETVSKGLLETVSKALPEGRATGADFLNPSYNPDLPLFTDSQLSVTFIDEGAGYRNSLGYYAYADGAFDGLTKGDVDTDGSGVVSLEELLAVESVEADYVFPNASKKRAGGRLLTGNTVLLNDGATFDAETTVGFFLTQNGWTGSDVRASWNGGDVQTMFTTDFLNPEAAATATTETNSSIDNSRHTAMLFSSGAQNEVILGFEDLNRIDSGSNAYGYRTDEDFNDAVFIVNATASDAFKEAEIATAPAAIPGNLLSSIIALSVFGFGYRRRSQS
ncbi:MAG: DUF4114 domain-containing protein [Geminicoccaceae bacterium]